MQRVRVLLEAGDLAAVHPPDMGDLGALGFVRGLEGPGVAAQGDDGLARVDQLVHLDGEALPLRGAPGEDAGEDGFGPDVRVAVGYPHPSRRSSVEEKEDAQEVPIEMAS